MSDIAERMKQAHDTLRATLGTPYEANAMAALKELVRRARGGPAPVVPRVTLQMRNRVHDLRHARTHEVPGSQHPWRGYPRAALVQRGAADPGVLGVIALVFVSLLSAAFLIGLLYLLGYRLLTSAEEREESRERAVWRQKRRELNDAIAARRLR